MKRLIKISSTILFLVFSLSSCADFEEINTRPDAFTADEVSAKYFLTGLQVELYGEGRFAYWRGNLLHGDRYAGQFTIGFNGGWWPGGLCYVYHAAYTDATYGWMSGYVSKLSAFQNFVKEGGELENEYYYAIGLIMKGLYYQMYTDTFGMVPYTEAFNPDIVTPAFDKQQVIYSGIIADLNKAMEIIGEATVTGEGVVLLTENDLFFNGDLQQWKKLANTLKLRVAMRAYGAPDASFAQTAISEALQNPLLTVAADNVLIEKDTKIDQFSKAAYGDVWHNFGGLGSKWTMGKTLIDYLRENNDPRLSKYAQPIVGGTVEFIKPETGASVALFDTYVDFVLKQLDDAGVPYTKTSAGSTITVTVGSGEYYVGQPTRLNKDIMPQVKFNLFSKPDELVINPKNSGLSIFPEVVMTAAEGSFLQARAAVKGLGGGNAQTLYQEGIRQSMLMWGVTESEIDNFLANEAMAQLTGTKEEKLEKVAIQQWIASYTAGFEAWAVVRDTGYPAELANGVSDYDIFAAGTLNGKYPQRMRYGNQAYNTNGVSVQAANQVQGADVQGTELWWAKE